MSNLTRRLLYGRNGIASMFSKHGYCMERAFCEKTPKQATEPPKQATERREQDRSSESEVDIDPSELTPWMIGRMGPYKALLKELAVAKPYEEVPKLPAIPFFGSSWMYFPIIGKYSSSRMYEADFDKQRIYGDIVRERFGKFEMVNSFHPDTNKLLRKHEGDYPARAEFSTIKTYREKRQEWYRPLGLMAMQGEEWWNFRVRVWPYLSSRDMDSTGLLSVASDLVNLIRVTRSSNNEIPDVIGLLNKWALESVCLVTLDARFDCLNPDSNPESDGMKMIKSVITQLACMNKLEASSGNFPFWKYFPTPTWLRFVRAADVFTGLVFKYIKVSVDHHLQNPDEEKATLLQKMLKEQKLDPQSIMVAIADIIMAGIDTTSHAVGYFLYLLAKHPAKQQLLYESLKEQFSEENTNPTPSAYFDYCYLESLRVLPVVRGNLRIFDHDVVLEGYRIPAGTAVLCVHEVFAKDERFYTNANEFMPERHRMAKILIHPFGVGIRSCLGENLAYREVFSVVFKIIQNYRLESDEDIKMVTRLINIPDKPIKIRFIER